MIVKDLNSYFIHDDRDLKDKVLREMAHPLKLDIYKSVVNELYSIYEMSLIKENNLDKELFFIQILVLLSDNLIKYDKLTLFAKRYIKCSVDSAGYNLQLCSLSRQFLLSLVKNSGSQAEFILSYLTDIFVGSINVIEDTKEDKSTQIYEEHQRFIRSNSEQIIVEAVNSSDVQLFFNKLNTCLLDENTRLPSLDILALVLVKSSNENVSSILNTPLFESLINCLCYDESNVILNTASTCLTLILPFIVTELPIYLSKLIFIYTRLVSLTLVADEDATPNIEKADPLDNKWHKIVNWENEENIELDYSKLFSFLYGLFPLNLAHFFKNHNHYFEQLDKHLVNNLIHNNRYDFFEVKSISMGLFDKCKFHKNFFNFNSPDEELRDTVRWKQIGNHDDIAKMCMEHNISNMDTGTNEDRRADFGQLLGTHKELYTTRKSISSMDSTEESISSSLESGGSYNGSSNVEFYKRELLLIRNDLNFTIYLKNLNELKLKNVLELYKTEIENHKMLESSVLNLKILSNKNTQLTKSLDQLKEEYKKFKNERLNYEELILSKNKTLRKTNEDNQLEIKTLNLLNEENIEEISNLKQLLLPKDIEINDLKLNVTKLKNDVEELKRQLETHSKLDEKLTDSLKLDGEVLQLTDKLAEMTSGLNGANEK